MKVTQSCLTRCDPMDYSPGQKTGVGSLSLLQGIFPTQGSNPGLSHCRWILYQLSHKINLWNCWISNSLLWELRKRTINRKTYAQKYLILISIVFKRFMWWNQLFSQQFYIFFRMRRSQVTQPNSFINIYLFNSYLLAMKSGHYSRYLQCSSGQIHCRSRCPWSWCLSQGATPKLQISYLTGLLTFWSPRCENSHLWIGS